MRVIHIYNLPHDQDELETAQHAHGYRSVMYEIARRLRAMDKHEEHDADARAVIEELRSTLYEEAGEYGITVGA